MKKTNLLLLFFIVCFSCQSQLELEDGDPDVKECGKIEINESEFLTMQFVPEKVSSNSTNQWIVENHTTHDMYWGLSFSLEYYEKNNWKVVPIHWEWETLGRRLLAGEVSTNETIIAGQRTLYTLVKELNQGKKGKYRIIQTFSLIDIGNYKLCAEFEII